MHTRPSAHTNNLREYYYSGQLSLVGWANVHYASLPTGYFDEGASALELNPFTHCWSLGVEEQFYFLFPALVVLAYGRQVWEHLRFLSTHRAPPLHTIRVSSTLPQPLPASAWTTSLLTSLSTLLLQVSRTGPAMPRALAKTRLLWLTLGISAIYSFYVSASAPTLAFYLLPSRFWQLMSGAILHELQAEVGAPARRVQAAITAGRPVASRGATISTLVDVSVVLGMELAALVLLVSALLITPNDHGFPAPWSLLAVLGAVCFIGSGSAPPTRWPCGFTTPVFNTFVGGAMPAYIGRLSYPLYLWHWPVYVGFKWTVGLTTAGARASAILLTAVAAFATYHGIEGAFRKWRPKRQSRIFLVLLPAVLLLELWLGALRGPVYGHLYAALAAVVPRSPLPPSPSLPPPLPPSPSLPPPPAPPPPTAPRMRPAPPPTPPSPPSPPQLPPLPSPPPPQLPPLPSPPPLGRCACNPSSPTRHVPPGAVDDPSLEACYTPMSPHDEPFFQGDVNAKIISRAFFQQDECFFLVVPPNLRFTTLNELHSKVGACLTPQRGAGMPERAIFMIGDSHADSLSHGLARAAEGALSMVWVGAGDGCGYHPAGVTASTMTSHHENCKAYNDAVNDALRGQVRASDVVLVMNAGYKWMPAQVPHTARTDRIRP